MSSLLATLADQILYGSKNRDAISDLVRKRILPGSLDMSVFSAWTEKQRPIIAYLRGSIHEFTPKDRIRIYVAVTEFKKNLYVPFLSGRLLEEDDTDCKAFLQQLLIPGGYQP